MEAQRSFYLPASYTNYSFQLSTNSEFNIESYFDIVS